MKPRILIPVFFGITLLIGLLNYRSYGISWDEPMQRELGNYCVDFIKGDNYGLYTMQNRFHGGNFETVCALPERIFNLEETRSIYYSRHLMIYLSFWIGTIFFYLLGNKILGNYRWALLATVFLYISPRIFAHAFYNSKDIPFLSAFVFGAYFLVRFIEKPGWFNAAALALGGALAISNRITGMLVPAFAIGFVAWNLISGKWKARQLLWLLPFLVLLPLFTIACWPVLWTEPLYNFTESIRMMSKFPFDDPQLFMGEFVKPSDLPWYYVPVWIAISVPVLYQFLCITGLFILLGKFVIKPVNTLRSDWKIFFLAGWIFLPWLMVLVLHSIIYDEWRHLFFTYPAMLLLGTWGCMQVWNFLESRYPKLRWGIVALIAWQLIVTSIFMIRWNPYQGVYFNGLARGFVEKKFEMDYWGVSYREAWEYLLKTDPDADIEIMWQNPSGEYNLNMVSSDERKRLVPTYYMDTKYFVTDYRFRLDYSDYPEKYHSIVVDGLEICTIYKNPYRKKAE